MTIGEKINKERKSKGWSMSKLARMSELSGGKQHVYKLEKGEVLPSILTIYKLSSALDIHPSELLNL